jgi:PAS domain S-box-containing protein
MALTDDQRKIIDVNSAMAQLMGYRPSQMRGTHTWDYVVGGPLMSHEEWHHAITRGEVTGEGDVRHADGSVVRVQFAIHPEVVTGQRLVLFVALNTSRSGRHARRADEPAELAALSAREQEIVRLVAAGESGPEIAAQLHISYTTVRTHVRNAMTKVGARSRAHLVAKALGQGHAL